MAGDDEHFERALGRISRMMLALVAAGAIGGAAWRGWNWGAGFAAGALAGWLNYRILKRMVNALGTRRPGRAGVAVMAGTRYLLLGGAAYVTLRSTRISLPAALAGLCVPAGAVILEILFELIYAGT
jgi:ATP synthase I chain